MSSVPTDFENIFLALKGFNIWTTDYKRQSESEIIKNFHLFIGQKGQYFDNAGLSFQKWQSRGKPFL